jgi:hypothetical protein
LKIKRRRSCQIPGNPRIFVKSCKVSQRMGVAGYCQSRAGLRVELSPHFGDGRAG